MAQGTPDELRRIRKEERENFSWFLLRTPLDRATEIVNSFEDLGRVNDIVNSDDLWFCFSNTGAKLELNHSGPKVQRFKRYGLKVLLFRLQIYCKTKNGIVSVSVRS